MFNVLIAEDDANIRRLIAIHLMQSGFSVTACEDGESALRHYENQHVDLLITDIMMPRMSGNELAHLLREQNKDLPILMLTALEAFEDKEKGFHSGADDYVVKPVDMKELVLRVKALLRRYKITSENRIDYKSLSLQYAGNVALVAGQSIELTKKEFMLLYKLVSHPDIIFTRNQLIDEIWGFDSESLDRTVDTHMKRIREKLKCEDLELITVRGLGYKAVLK
ncbi:MAG: response regulator transcription factor [bacterium]